jgi:hypothetical protein
MLYIISKYCYNAFSKFFFKSFKFSGLFFINQKIYDEFNSYRQLLLSKEEFFDLIKEDLALIFYAIIIIFDIWFFIYLYKRLPQNESHFDTIHKLLLGLKIPCFNQHYLYHYLKKAHVLVNHSLILRYLLIPFINLCLSFRLIYLLILFINLCLNYFLIFYFQKI